jgi:hypothetical protein
VTKEEIRRIRMQLERGDGDSLMVVGFVGIRGMYNVIRALAVGAGFDCGMGGQKGRFGFDCQRG